MTGGQNGVFLDEGKRFTDLVSDITAYMDYLRTKISLFISVHQIDEPARLFMGELLPYNEHICPYCSFLKENPAIHRVCREHQLKLSTALEDGPFFGTCWAGVGEFVFPVFHINNEYIGFLSVSGYRGDPAKTRAQTEKIIKKYGVNRENMLRMQETLKEEHPALNDIRTLIQPLVYMFSLLQLYLEDDHETGDGKNMGSADLFARVRNFIRTNYRNNYQLSDLAEIFGCSEGYLSHLFRVNAGCGYRQLVNSIRISVSKVYLMNTGMNIQQISDFVGYSDSNYFSTVFRKECGVSPAEFRKRHRRASRNATHE